MRKVLFNCIVLEIICLTHGASVCKTGRGGLGIIKGLNECTELIDKLKQIRLFNGNYDESRAFYILEPYIVSEKKVCCPECYTPDGQSGVCRAPNECPYIMKMLQNLTDSNIYYLKHSQCNIKGDEIKVCCGPKPSSVRAKSCQMSAFPPLPNSGCCGVEAISFNKIMGGSTTRIDQYPWLVLLEYVYNRQIETFCGGTLISGKYVLTAAHCVIKTEATYFQLPIKVRVGEFDKSNNGRDCVDIGNGEDCTDPAISIPIEKIIRHPHYDIYKKWNDIAIIRLQFAVNYTDFVRPICLPYSDIDESQLPYWPKVHVAGWGKTRNDESASRKQHVEVSLVHRKICQYKYKRILNVDRELWERQLCAYDEGGKDACNGDSGGPLMLKKTHEGKRVYEVLGLVSYGPLECGIVPGIYTKVDSYVPWIRSHIKL